MQKQIRNTALAIISSVAVLFTYTAQADDNIPQMKADCLQAVADLQRADTSMGTFFTNAAGCAIFPDVGKGGFIIGGARGSGLVFVKGGNMVPIGRTTMTQASVGAQIGGQTFDEVIFFETPEALNNFKQGSWEMSADVSAVAAAEGAAQAAKYTHGVIVITLPKKGLMAQASIGGQKFTFEPITQ
jgi:lipid-binding SYLF domain-containing protein